MIITDIKYGNRQVNRVYLNDKIIWSHIPSLLIYASGETQSITYTYADLNACTVVFFNGQGVNNSYSDVINRIFDSLSIDGKSTQNSYLVGNGVLFNADVMSGGIVIETDGTADCATKHSVAAQSKVLNQTYTSDANPITPHSILLSAPPEESNTYTQSIADTTFRVLASLRATSESDYESIVRRANMLLLESDIVAENSYDEASAKSFIPVFINGDTASSYSNENSICMIYPTIDVGEGDAYSFSYGDATFTAVDIAFLNGSDTSELDTYADVELNIANLMYGSEELEQNTDSSLILWYPPVGDGIPLVENDGVDIEISGNLLEVRQAHQINIDEENKILEVM